MFITPTTYPWGRVDWLTRRRMLAPLQEILTQQAITVHEPGVSDGTRRRWDINRAMFTLPGVAPLALGLITAGILDGLRGFMIYIYVLAHVYPAVRFINRRALRTTRFILFPVQPIDKGRDAELRAELLRPEDEDRYRRAKELIVTLDAGEISRHDVGQERYRTTWQELYELAGTPSPART